MKFISGTFVGKYKGKEVDPLSLQTYSALHFLEVDPGATMHNCEWIDDYSGKEYKSQFIQVHSIPMTDFYFNSKMFPNEKSFRDNMHSCILLNPHVHSITRKNGYTFGTIEGTLFGSIGDWEEKESIETKKDINPLAVISSATLPILVTDPTPSFIAEKPSTWKWTGCLSALFWFGLFAWGLWWLLNHRGCNPVAKVDNTDFIKTDSAVVKEDNDTLRLQPGNLIFSVYDWSIEDNDTITLFLNGKILRSNIPLTNSIVSWMAPGLPKGNYTLLIKSINNGTIGPASPTIEINDGKNNQIFQISVYKGQPKKLNLLLN